MLYFESDNELKFYNLEAWSFSCVIALGSVPTFCIVEHTILNARTFEITLT